MATREYPAPLAAPAQAVQFPHRNVADSGRTGRAGKQGSTFQELGPALPGAANAPEPMAAPPHRSLLAEMHGRPRQAQTHAVEGHPVRLKPLSASRARFYALGSSQLGSLPLRHLHRLQVDQRAELGPLLLDRNQ
jgi:hypothetical protein